MKKREPGIDLIRCVGLLFVVGIHFFYNNGFYFVPQDSLRILPGNTVRYLFFCCNGIFMMLTGYLKTTQPLRGKYYRSLLPVLVSYTIASAVSIPIRHFCFGDAQSLSVWITRFFTFFGVNYGWYIEMYVGLVLISPILNLAMDKLESDRGVLFLTGTLVVLTALPSATDLQLAPDFWTGMYPLTYYAIGAAIRRLQPKMRVWQGLGGAMLVSLGMGIATLLTADENFSSGFGQGYGGFWTTATAALLFLGLYRIRVGERMAKLLAWAAGGVFEGYMLSHLLDAWVYRLAPQWMKPGLWPAAFLCITIPVFLLSLLAGKALHSLTARLVRPRHSGRSAASQFAG